MGNTGHGHVFPREDGVKARCGGPGLCAICSSDLVIKQEDERRASKNNETFEQKIYRASLDYSKSQRYTTSLVELEKAHTAGANWCREQMQAEIDSALVLQGVDFGHACEKHEKHYKNALQRSITFRKALREAREQLSAEKAKSQQLEVEIEKLRNNSKK